MRKASHALISSMTLNESKPKPLTRAASSGLPDRTWDQTVEGPSDVRPCFRTLFELSTLLLEENLRSKKPLRSKPRGASWPRFARSVGGEALSALEDEVSLVGWLPQRKQFESLNPQGSGSRAGMHGCAYEGRTPISFLDNLLTERTLHVRSR